MMTLVLDKPKLDNLTSDIWKSAERLRGKFKAYEYQNVILPTIVIRRLKCVLIGRGAIWEGAIKECYDQNAINRVRAKRNSSTRYLYYWLYNLKIVSFIDAVVERITIAHLDKQIERSLPTVSPSFTNASPANGGFRRRMCYERSQAGSTDE